MLSELRENFPYLLNRDHLRQLGIWQSDSTLSRWEAEGRFPKHLKLGGTACAWYAHEIFAWLDQCDSARDRRIYPEDL
jgi:prophage regulatory protein